MNIATWVSEQAAARADAPAIKQGDLVLTYQVLDSAVSRCARLLADAGVGVGDRVALIMPNVAYFPIVYYAALKLGAVVLPQNPLLKSGEIEYLWNDATPKVAVALSPVAEESSKAGELTGVPVIVATPGEFDATIAGAEPITEVVDRDGDDTAVLLYTSGTTGQPKGAELTHNNIRSNTVTMIEVLQATSEDVIFGGLPLFHVFGQTCAMNLSVAAGATLDLLPKFDPVEALRIIAEDKVTVFEGVPTMYIALLAAAEKVEFDASSVRVAASGGAAIPVETLTKVEQVLKFPVLEGYGLSETAPVATFNQFSKPSKPGSIGWEISGVEVRLVDEQDNDVPEGEIGEITIRGENVMKGYWNKPEATEVAMRGGWFHTGDLARRDADGFIFIVDRKKDMIIRNGYNVYPREVEEVLYTHPDVVEAAVVGVPHPVHGEEVAAMVTLREGSAATEEEIVDYVKERVAAYKFPRIVRFGGLPKGPTGKILKREISIN
ncbi:long-chain-fatty-acid--CoA ligase [Naumannella halotolerans]|uniref:Long-chain acyl-CoA synthetase n=1 Tax=Naumannella halotolerans TaxID=993414 RepID=A0A4R7JA15_9ACTN|nr:long-chain fatty acid--CoA ligase [Naumannella halotolerans]TDT34401.1 long-chain acyl-CoA synthetase [Naumannella halotolerans]